MRAETPHRLVPERRRLLLRLLLLHSGEEEKEEAEETRRRWKPDAAEAAQFTVAHRPTVPQPGDQIGSDRDAADLVAAPPRSRAVCAVGVGRSPRAGWLPSRLWSSGAACTARATGTWPSPT